VGWVLRAESSTLSLSGADLPGERVRTFTGWSRRVNPDEVEEGNPGKSGALLVFVIGQRSRLHYSLHHPITPGWTAFFLLKKLPQRLLNLRQPVLADGASLHRLFDFRNKGDRGHAKQY